MMYHFCGCEGWRRYVACLAPAQCHAARGNVDTHPRASAVSSPSRAVADPASFLHISILTRCTWRSLNTRGTVKVATYLF